MIHPIPPGTRDVLPDEMRELRALSARLRELFEAAEYGEVRTPALEYEDVLRRGDERAASAPFRLFDEQGRVLVLRSDMTIPIARLVASRYADAEPPLRFCYFQHAYRAPERARTSTEFLQGGIELIGVRRHRGRGRAAHADRGEPRGGRPSPAQDRRGGRRALPDAAVRAGGSR